MMSMLFLVGLMYISYDDIVHNKFFWKILSDTSG